MSVERTSVELMLCSSCRIHFCRDSRGTSCLRYRGARTAAEETHEDEEGPSWEQWKRGRWDERQQTRLSSSLGVLCE